MGEQRPVGRVDDVTRTVITGMDPSSAIHIMRVVIVGAVMTAILIGRADAGRASEFGFSGPSSFDAFAGPERKGLGGWLARAAARPRSMMRPDSSICAAIEGGAPVSISTPMSHFGHARNMTIEHLLDRLTVPSTTNRHAEDLVFVPGACHDARRHAREQRQQDVSWGDGRSAPMAIGRVSRSPSDRTNRSRSARPPGNAILKLTSRTPFDRNDPGRVASSEWSVHAGD